MAKELQKIKTARIPPTKFDPKKTKARLAQADGVIKYAQEMKEWRLLDEAGQLKIKQTAEFVAWWKEKVKKPGNPTKKSRNLIRTEQNQLTIPRLQEMTEISRLQVLRWDKRLENPERYAFFLREPSYRKMWAGTDESLREERRKAWPKMIEGEFFLLYVDPPWQYEFSSSEQRHIEERQYPTMTLEEICALKVPAADDSLLFLWATSPKLADAMKVLEAWEFTYKTNAVWVKDRIGPGYYFRQQHELLLVGARGAPPLSPRSTRVSSVFNAERREQSHKPDIVAETLEKMYPELNESSRVELFARVSRNNWSTWGWDGNK